MYHFRLGKYFKYFSMVNTHIIKIIKYYNIIIENIYLDGGGDLK